MKVTYDREGYEIGRHYNTAEHLQIAAAWRVILERAQPAIEAEERAELARLKAKYPE